MTHVTLLGTEQVERAGYTIRDAAERMNRAAASLDHTLTTFQRTMEESTIAMTRLAEAIEIQNERSGT